MARGESNASVKDDPMNPLHIRLRRIYDTAVFATYDAEILVACLRQLGPDWVGQSKNGSFQILRRCDLSVVDLMRESDVTLERVCDDSETGNERTRQLCQMISEVIDGQRDAENVRNHRRAYLDEVARLEARKDSKS